MRPILFEILGWGVPSWHFFFVLAALTAYVFTLLAARRLLNLGHAPAQPFLDALSNLFVVCYLSGWFGARALSIAVEQFEVSTFFQFFKELFSIGPMTFYGGACAAVLFGSIYAKRRALDLKMALDLGVLGGVFALAVGRIGCFLNGDDYGVPVANQSQPPWWSVKFDVLQDGGIYRFPVQLEESIACLVIGVFGLSMLRKSYSPTSPVRSGRTAAWLALLTSAHRFFNEGFRGDPRGFFPGTQLSTSSGISLLIVAFCAYCLMRLRLAQARPG
ncbi:MAG: prolipoprotein diacylglyceryl transferase [Silvanigrellaceae bacterium]